MISFKDFINKYKIRNKAISNIKIYQVFSFWSLNNLKRYLGDRPFSSDVGIVKLNPSKGTQWDVYSNEKFFDSYGCSAPQKLSKFFTKQNGHCFFSEYNNSRSY